MNPSATTDINTKPRNGSPTPDILKTITPQVEPKLGSQFASAMMHEVRNPLSNINLSVEMLKAMISNNDQRIYLDIIMRSSRRINDLVNDLLTSFQADELQAEKHSINQLIDEVLTMNEDRIRLKNISIKKDYTARDYKMILNRAKMKIAFTNIIINAIDAMDPGKGELKLVSKSIGGKYVIKIEDNGCGISKKNLKNIFKPYFTNKPSGLGLGLSTTHDILQSNYVAVTVESEEGKGTSFILIFDKNLRYNPIQ